MLYIIFYMKYKIFYKKKIFDFINKSTEGFFQKRSKTKKMNMNIKSVMSCLM